MNPHGHSIAYEFVYPPVAARPHNAHVCATARHLNHPPPTEHHKNAPFFSLFAPAMCSPLRALRAYARRCRPISLALNTGFLSPYFATLNTGSGRPISLALNTGFLSPYFAGAQYGLFVALFRYAQYGLWAPAMCSPLRTLRAYARRCRSISPSGLNTGFLSPYFATLNTGFGLAMCSFHSAHTPVAVALFRWRSIRAFCRPISLALNTGSWLAMCSFHSAHTPAPLRYCPRAIRATH